MTNKDKDSKLWQEMEAFCQNKDLYAFMQSNNKTIPLHSLPRTSAALGDIILYIFRLFFLINDDIMKQQIHISLNSDTFLTTPHHVKKNDKENEEK